MPPLSLFANYVLVAVRNLRRDRVYGAINIAGLSLGIACCLVLGLYLSNALNFDAYHANSGRVYRVVNALTLNGKTDFAAATSHQLGPMMAEQHPEIIAFTRFREVSYAQSLLRDSQNQAYRWERLFYADPSVFTLFDFEVLAGDRTAALQDPASIAVSERFARRYFGDANPLGQQISTDTDTYRIDLVFADQPENTHLKYDALLSSLVLPEPEGTERREALWNISTYTYVMMPEGYDAAAFPALGQQFYDNNMRAMAEQLNLTVSLQFSLEALPDIHLHSTTVYDLPRGNMMAVYAFGLIAGFVLLVACINYMNLATARSIKRAKEVGMRKVLGAGRGQLVAQFMGESLVYVIASFVLALVLCALAFRFTSLSSLLDTPLEMATLLTPRTLAALTMGALVLGVLAGLYPAFALSATPPVAAFRGIQGSGSSRQHVRQALVLVQFLLSVTVIASTLLMLSQMRYVQTKPLGFAPENRLILPVSGADLVQGLPAFVNRVRAVPGVVTVATTDHLPGRQVGLNALAVEDNEGGKQERTLNVMNLRPGTVEALGIRLIAGRDFDEGRANDPRQTVLVNQSLVTAMGWEQPLGKRFSQVDAGEDTPDMLVIGVVEDFHYAGLQQPIVPLVMTYFLPEFEQMSRTRRNAYSEQLVIQIAPGREAEVLPTLQQLWASFDPAHPFDFRWLADDLNALYGSEERLLSLVGIFAGLCIFISCLGLFGLSAYNTALRTREIGIRKVLGASTLTILLELFKPILWLVAMAASLASLVTVWAVGRWLESFYYRIDLLGAPLLLLFVAAGLAVAVAFVTMALQSLKTAQGSPVLALRYA